jgi:glycosyltransferase involved in cell wall biosynthesis
VSLRILHLIESDGVYGAEQVVLNLVRATVQEHGPESALIGCLVKDPGQPNPLHTRAQELGIRAERLRLRNVQSPLDVPVLTQSLRRLHLSAIHAHGYKATVAGYTAHVVNRTPILATCHLWFEDSQTKWTYRLLGHLERRLYKRLDHVVAVSEPIAHRLGGWGVPSERLTVIPNGIALDATPPSETERRRLRAEFGVTEDAFVILNIGRLAEQKAQADLIDAAAVVRQAHPGISVAILGEGHLRRALEERIATLGLGDAVHILGFQSNTHEYLAAADAFALPSIDEGLPIALLEAAAASLPIVCTPVGAIPDLLAAGVSALFVPVHSVPALATAISRLVEEPALCRSIGRQARAAVERQYSVDRMYRAYRDIYAALSR